MDQEVKELYRTHLGESVLKGNLIQEKLGAWLEANEINPATDMDLNPHLYIKYICQQVANQVVDENVACSEEDVMLAWLTLAVYFNTFLPRVI